MGTGRGDREWGQGVGTGSGDREWGLGVGTGREPGDGEDGEVGLGWSCRSAVDLGKRERKGMGACCVHPACCAPGFVCVTVAVCDVACVPLPPLCAHTAVPRQAAAGGRARGGGGGGGGA